MTDVLVSPPLTPQNGPERTLPRGTRLLRAGLTAGGFGLLALFLYEKGIPCAFARVVHRPCPGCGSTRAVIALLHGDTVGVLRYNPLGPVMAVLLGVLGLQALGSVLRSGDLRGTAEGRIGTIVKTGIVVVAGLEMLLWTVRWFGVLGGPVPV